MQACPLVKEAVTVTAKGGGTNAEDWKAKHGEKERYIGGTWEYRGRAISHTSCGTSRENWLHSLSTTFIRRRAAVGMCAMFAFRLTRFRLWF